MTDGLMRKYIRLGSGLTEKAGEFGNWHVNRLTYFHWRFEDNVLAFSQRSI